MIHTFAIILVSIAAITGVIWLFASKNDMNTKDEKESEQCTRPS